MDVDTDHRIDTASSAGATDTSGGMTIDAAITVSSASDDGGKNDFLGPAIPRHYGQLSDTEYKLSTENIPLDHLRAFSPTVYNDTKWMESHTKGWIHGTRKPYSVLRYDVSTSKSTKSRLSKSYDQDILIPSLDLDEIQYRTSASTISTDDKHHHEAADPHSNPEDDETDDDFNSISHINQVNDKVKQYTKPRLLPRDDGHGYLSAFCTIPRTYINISSYYSGGKFDVPKLCFQNHFEFDHYNYTFGGLCISEGSELTELGIPRETPLDKISVYFPTELPPFLPVSLFANPLMCQNQHFYKFNSIRSTLTFLDNIADHEYPRHLNSMESCQISKRHVFFFGGFILKVTSVNYDPDIDRWIIHKRLTLNEDGYILDLITLKFTKIDLKPQDTSLPIGRLGCGLTSSQVSNYSTVDFPEIPSGPAIFSESKPRNTVQANVPSYETPKTPEPLSKTEASLIAGSRTIPSTPLDSNIKSSLIRSVSAASSPYVTKSSKLKSNESNIESTSSKLSSSFQSSKTPTSASSETSVSSMSPVSRMSTVLSKSSRLFHRHKTTPNVPVNQLRNTYSKQVEKHRSNANSGVSLTSPPNSPSPTNLPLRVNTEISSTSLEPAPTPIQTSAMYTSYSPNSSAGSLDSKGYSKVEKMIDDSYEKRQNQILVEDAIKNGVSTTTIFVFGGFESKIDEDGFQTFVASNRLLRIELPSDQKNKKVVFDTEARVSEVVPTPGELWPSPRGYFAKTIINYSDGEADKCLVNLGINDDDVSTIQDGATSPDNSSSSQSFLSQRCTDPKLGDTDEFLDGKAFLFQGGINENYESFSDFYLYVFSTGKWQTLDTYSYDYFEDSKQPYQDDHNSRLSKKKEVSNPQFVDAELRACHHTTMYYQSEGSEYLIFMGGLRNNLLRHYDKSPYKSAKFDVSRLAKFPFSTQEANTMRIPILNLQSHTWTYVRYHYDFDDVITEKYYKRITGNSYWNNTMIANFGGSITMTAKRISICHGLVIPVPEKSDDFKKIQNEIPTDLLLWGANIHFTFPSI